MKRGRQPVAPEPPRSRVGRARPPSGHETLDELVNWRLIGSGTTAEVWVARQPSLRRDVAIKSFFQPVRDENDRRRFDQERQALGEFSHHRNVVDVHFSGVDDQERPFLMMRHYARGSLEDVLRGGRILAAQEVVDIGRQIAQALVELHGSGRQHRDVKPANVLLSDSGEAVLGDFGISGDRNDLAASQVMAMSPLHASPEVLERGGASDTADVWSLASTMYTALLGRAPFARTEPGPDSPLDLRLRVMADPLPALNPRQVPDDVVAVLTASLLRDPATRTQTALELASQLENVQRAHGWDAGACPAPSSAPSFDPGATGTATGARIGEPLRSGPLSSHDDPVVAAGGDPPTAAAWDEGSTPRFAAEMTAMSGAAARHVPEPVRPPERVAPQRNRKRAALIAGGVVALLLVALSIYGAIGAGSNKQGPSGTGGGNSPAVAPVASVTSGAATPASRVPSAVKAVSQGTTVTVRWAGTSPAGAFGAVVSDGERTWAATTSGHVTLTGIPAGKQACYAVSWLLNAQGTTDYSVPACVNGATATQTP